MKKSMYFINEKDLNTQLENKKKRDKIMNRYGKARSLLTAHLDRTQWVVLNTLMIKEMGIEK